MKKFGKIIRVFALILVSVTTTVSLAGPMDDCKDRNPNGRMECTVVPQDISDWEYQIAGPIRATAVYPDAAGAIGESQQIFANNIGSDLCGPITTDVPGWSNTSNTGFDYGSLAQSQTQWVTMHWTRIFSRDDPTCYPQESGALLARRRVLSCGKGWSHNWDGDTKTEFCYRLVERPNECGFGNPIFPQTGTKRQHETDYISAPSLGYTFERYYQNTSWNSTSGSDVAIVAQSFGAYWRHNYYRRIKAVASSSNSPNEIKYAWVQRANKTSYFFAGKLLDNNKQEFTGRPEQSDRLSPLLGANGSIIGWEYWDDEGTYERYVGENIVRSVRRDGRVLTWTTGPYGLTRVEDNTGRGLSFRYDALGRLIALAPPDGLEITYAYNASESSASPQLATDNLIAATYPDQRTRRYGYGEPENISAGIASGHALTSITDEDEVRLANFRYNNAGCPWGCVN